MFEIFTKSYQKFINLGYGYFTDYRCNFNPFAMVLGHLGCFEISIRKYLFKTGMAASSALISCIRINILFSAQEKFHHKRTKIQT